MPQIGDTRRNDNHQKYVWHACEMCQEPRWVILYHGKPRSRYCRACTQKTPEMRAIRSVNSSGRRHTEATKQRLRGLQLGKFGKYSPSWKGGKTTDRGYARVKLMPGDFFLVMADKERYVAEHRLVMAKQLGRCLHPWEVVHHKNHNKGDNRIENLQLVSGDKHSQITILECRVKSLEDKVQEQATEIRLLQWRLKEYADNEGIRAATPSMD